MAEPDTRGSGNPPDRVISVTKRPREPLDPSHPIDGEDSNAEMSSHSETSTVVSASASDRGARDAKRSRPERRKMKDKGKKSVAEVPDSSPVIPKQPEAIRWQRGLLDLPQEVLLEICAYLDSQSQHALRETCRLLDGALNCSERFWKMMCVKEEFTKYPCLFAEDEDPDKGGYRGLRMRVQPPSQFPRWKKFFAKGCQMRRNFWRGNVEASRVFANTNLPVATYTPDVDLNHVRAHLGDFPKMLESDDIKYAFSDKYMVAFHHVRNHGTTTLIHLWDISGEPTFIYRVDMNHCRVTENIAIFNDHVVITPSLPLNANALIMTLDMGNYMARAGSYIFPLYNRQNSLDDNWFHTQLRVVRNQALVTCRIPRWHMVVFELPSCTHLYEVQLDVSSLYECRHIRSNKSTAMALYKKKENSSNVVVTVDIAGRASCVRSDYDCEDVLDITLFSDSEEVYLLRRNGDVLIFDDASLKTETAKIASEDPPVAPEHQHLNDYQLFVNGKDQICVMQSAGEVPAGRYIKVYSRHNYEKLYSINLDLCRYGLCRDQSICMYANRTFIAAADCEKLLIFDFKTGKYLGTIQVPPHLERKKTKEDKDCLYQSTGLGRIKFDEEKLILFHDNERHFPAVMDMYRFW